MSGLAVTGYQVLASGRSNEAFSLALAPLAVEVIINPCQERVTVREIVGIAGR
ncbi:hypothetical protein D8674_038667 [Pyrus ussuriensis x Pyrus communis]|uniref:Uncharacterized protein n=1 Tax=Pyrus ussuriensis x Pyrus communis TaxID=2448454 RepID=A0A5N5HWE3_9ROSA|nr:hypothetical protein D8674_038667 [Pyrus ussuriensis x Pyrus communis]